MPRVVQPAQCAARIEKVSSHGLSARDGRRGINRMENEFHRIVDALPGLVWSALPDGRVELVNRRWHDYTGHALDESINVAWQSAIHPQDLPRWMEGWRSLPAPAGVWELEIRLRRFDGAYRWFLCRACPLTNASGDIIGWCGISSDIDDRRRAESELRAIETNYSEFVESFPGLVVTMDMSGQVELFSSELLEYFGKTREDLRTGRRTIRCIRTICHAWSRRSPSRCRRESRTASSIAAAGRTVCINGSRCAPSP